MRIYKSVWLAGDLDFFGFDDAVCDGEDGEGGEAFCAEFFGDVLAVGDDGGEADAEAVCHFFVDAAGDEEAEYFALAGCEEVGGLGGGLCAADGFGRLAVAAVGAVGGLGEAEEGADELVFGLADVEGVEALGELTRFVAVDEDDGLVLAGEEVGGVAEEDLGGDEVVEELTLVGRLHAVEIVEDAYFCAGHHAGDDARKAQRGEGVGDEDGDLGLPARGVCHSDGRFVLYYNRSGAGEVCGVRGKGRTAGGESGVHAEWPAAHDGCKVTKSFWSWQISQTEWLKIRMRGGWWRKISFLTQDLLCRLAF